MGPTSERVATFACGLGRRFTLHDLAAMTDISVPGLLPPVNELLQADIFAEEDSYLTFRHDLIREAVRGSLSAPVRRAVDRQAADVLMSRGALPTEVAIQLAESAQPGDSVAIETILKAAQVLTNSDPGGAAELAARALELAPRRHPLRGPLVACRAVCLFAAGRAEEAKRFADSALRQVLPAEEQARVRFSVASMFDLSPVIRAENARAGLALPSLPAELRASLSAALYHSLAVAGYTEEALEVRESARRAAYQSTDPTSWLRFEVPEAGVQYQSLEFAASTRDRKRRGGEGPPRAGRRPSEARPHPAVVDARGARPIRRSPPAAQRRDHRRPTRSPELGAARLRNHQRQAGATDGRPRRGRRSPGEPLHPRGGTPHRWDAARSRRGGPREAQDPSGRPDAELSRSPRSPRSCSAATPHT